MLQTQVNQNKCQEVANIIKTIKFKPDFHNRPYLTFTTDLETKARVFLYSLAICHQTYGLGSKKLGKTGWEYLESVYTDLGKSNSNLTDPSYLATLSVADLSEKLACLFSDTGLSQDTTLTRLDERAGFIIDCSQVLVSKYHGLISELLNQSGGLLLNNGLGLYERLAEFKGYVDPLRKKSSGFIKFLVDAGDLKIADWDNYIPMMDYHAQRVLMRLGCVEVLDKDLEQKLKSKTKIPSDEPVRNASVEATILIAKLAGWDVSRMNDVFFPLGRSFCLEKTLCKDHTYDKDRMLFDKVVDLPSYDKCIFEPICLAKYDDEYLKFWQPIVDTTGY